MRELLLGVLTHPLLAKAFGATQITPRSRTDGSQAWRDHRICPR